VKLGDLIALRLDIVIECLSPRCGEHTRLGAAFFHRRRGPAVTLEELKRTMICPGCGQKDIDLTAAKPGSEAA
jgi:hypothetical protein